MLESVPFLVYNNSRQHLICVGMKCGTEVNTAYLRQLYSTLR